MNPWDYHQKGLARSAERGRRMLAQDGFMGLSKMNFDVSEEQMMILD